MSETNRDNSNCLVIGASHAGVNFAFALRREGWKGTITLIDSYPELPYHRPPLSKTLLAGEEQLSNIQLKPASGYDQAAITLKLGTAVNRINVKQRSVQLADGDSLPYNQLVIATGARPLIPNIPGLKQAKRVFALRTAKDVHKIRESLAGARNKRVVIIGGGYIGLEVAASLNNSATSVIVLEREERVLARVTAAEMSEFFMQLHQENGVSVLTSKNVVSISTKKGVNHLDCEDGTTYQADLIILGVGIRVNTELAAVAGIDIDDGIRVDMTTKTNLDNVFAIGDCTNHYNRHYDRFIRLESVQNAVDQAKVAAATICKKEVTYNAIPWFWSDQYGIKLQMVGLSDGYDLALVRKENGEEKCFSIWYFSNDKLLAVDAVNNTRAYVYGTKIIKGGQRIDKSKLVDPAIELKLPNILIE